MLSRLDDVFNTDHYRIRQERLSGYFLTSFQLSKEQLHKRFGNDLVEKSRFEYQLDYLLIARVTIAVIKECIKYRYLHNMLAESQRSRQAYRSPKGQRLRQLPEVGCILCKVASQRKAYQGIL